MKQLPDCLFEVECGTADLFEMGRIFLEPNIQLEVPLGLYAKTFPPETIGLEPIFPCTMLPSPDLGRLYEFVFYCETVGGLPTTLGLLWLLGSGERSGCTD